jgi:hypothetical protein
LNSSNVTRRMERAWQRIWQAKTDKWECLWRRVFLRGYSARIDMRNRDEFREMRRAQMNTAARDRESVAAVAASGSQSVAGLRMDTTTTVVVME